MPALVQLNKCFLGLLLCSVVVTYLHNTFTKLLLIQLHDSFLRLVEQGPHELLLQSCSFKAVTLKTKLPEFAKAL